MIFESIFFLIFSTFTVISSVGYGQLIGIKSQTNFFDNFFFGLIFISFLITIVHFFTKISFFVSLIILSSGVILFLIKKNFFSIKTVKKNIKFLILFLFLVPIFLSQKYHEDFGYYHLTYVITMMEEKIIFGLANSNIAYSHNSIWLNIISIFSLPKNDFNFLTLPAFLAYYIFIAFSLKKILESNKQTISSYFLLVCLFYFILKFTRISEYGNDLPCTIFSILAVFYFLKFSESTIQQKKPSYFLCCFSFAAFSILIKFSAIPIFLLPLYLFITNFKKLRKEIIKYNYIFIFILCFIFFLQQFVYTGCLLFPSKLTCLNVSWSNDDFFDLRKNIELINKSYSVTGGLISKKEYLENLNWFPYWLKRNYSELLEHLITMLIPIILLKILLKKNKNADNLSFENKKIFYLFILISFVFWFKFSPVYRFAVPYFLCLIFIITLRFNIIKKFSTNLFLILIVVSILFNFSKNILRISDKKEVFLGIEKIDNKFFIDQSSINEFIFVHRPDIKNNKNGWQGRLCWDISFICSYNKIKVDKKYNYLFLTKLSN